MELTREAVLAMPAGAELDELVAGDSDARGRCGGDVAGNLGAHARARVLPMSARRRDDVRAVARRLCPVHARGWYVPTCGHCRKFLTALRARDRRAVRLVKRDLFGLGIDDELRILIAAILGRQAP